MPLPRDTKNDNMKRNFGPPGAYILGRGQRKRLTISQINKINTMLQMTNAAEKNEAGSEGYLEDLLTFEGKCQSERRNYVDI